ncbi:MAG: hypothetical protein JXR53_07715 [Bacteroidales bacterium]|nr:hypothetical protein [Bacteroidales bacterium]
MKFKMFHVPKPRKFGYSPIYYNPDEEETVRAGKKNKPDSANGKEEKANKYWQTDMNRINRRKSVNITMYLIIAILLLVVIFFI